MFDICRTLVSEVPNTSSTTTSPTEVDADTPARLKAFGDPLRMLMLDLVLERAMSVTELADRVGRPRGSVAHHVDLLVDAGLLQVVRTRKVRAMEERFYGRTARTIDVPRPAPTTATCRSSPMRGR